MQQIEHTNIKLARITSLSTGAPLVSIIVVNYNGMVHLPECLDALTAQHYPAFEVLVVDNGSTDGSLAYVAANYPEVRTIASRSNLGYSGAVNLALNNARGAYIAVLNMDAMVEPDWLHPLIAFLEAHPEVGAVTPKIVLYHQPDRINALGQNVHVTALGFNRAYNRPDRPDATAPIKVSGLHGAAFVLRKSLLAQMGGMNEACFLYHEDVDLSWMVQLMGYDIYCLPAAVVRHKYTLKMDAQKLYFLERNRLSMLLSNVRWTTLVLLAPLLALTECMMLAYCLRRGRSFIAAKARALSWAWRRREQIIRRRAQVQALRRRSDLQMIANLRLAYEWDQLITLGR
jgi:GT2 family glycosyltransferase